MPNKTIYVKDADVPLLEQAQAQLGESVSSMFADFLRERVARLTPEENRIIDLINEIGTQRDAAGRDRLVPAFVDDEYAEAQSYAEKALKTIRAGDISRTKGFFWAANTYFDRAQRDRDELKTLNGKITDLLGTAPNSARRRK